MNQKQPTMAQERAKFLQAQANLHSGTYKAEGDLIDYSLYDSLYLDNGNAQQSFFVNGLGATDPVTGNRKVISDTNVRGSTPIPQGQKLMVKYIKLFWRLPEPVTEAILNDYYDTLANTTFNIRIENKDTYGIWGGDEIMNFPLSGVLVPANAGDNSRPMTIEKGIGVYPLELPIVLASLTTFEVVMNSDVAPVEGLDGTKVKLSLCGVLGRLS